MTPVASFWTAWGLARSLLIYYAKPGRFQRDRRFYARFLSSGALVFDIGAHVGNRSRVFLRLGATCVAVEPQPLFAALLLRLYGRNPAFHLISAALGSRQGPAALHISRRTPTVSTTAPAWKDQVARAPSFARVAWEDPVPASQTTLDHLISRFGRPDLCKIDVEGAELDVLNGLSQPLPLISFEYIPAVASLAIECVARLETLGSYQYNWTPGESQILQEQTWLSPPEMTDRLSLLEPDEPSGDIYARLT